MTRVSVERADLQQAIPVGARAGQLAEASQAEDCPGFAPARPVRSGTGSLRGPRRSAGESLVLIDDGDGRPGPAQLLVGSLHQIVLPGGAGRVLEDLEQSGLPDVDVNAGRSRWSGRILGLPRGNCHHGSPCGIGDCLVPAQPGKSELCEKTDKFRGCCRSLGRPYQDVQQGEGAFHWSEAEDSSWRVPPLFGSKGCKDRAWASYPRAGQAGPAESQQGGSGKRPCRRRLSMNRAIWDEGPEDRADAEAANGRRDAERDDRIVRRVEGDGGMAAIGQTEST